MFVPAFIHENSQFVVMLIGHPYIIVLANRLFLQSDSSRNAAVFMLKY